jgi:hypothetical protein
MTNEADLANITIFLNFVSDHRRPTILLAFLGLHFLNRGYLALHYERLTISSGPTRLREENRRNNQDKNDGDSQLHNPGLYPVRDSQVLINVGASSNTRFQDEVKLSVASATRAASFKRILIGNWPSSSGNAGVAAVGDSKIID